MEILSDIRFQAERIFDEARLALADSRILNIVIEEHIAGAKLSFEWVHPSVAEMVREGDSITDILERVLRESGKELSEPIYTVGWSLPKPLTHSCLGATGNEVCDEKS